jgi:DnaJ-domain-containing protein 1
VSSIGKRLLDLARSNLNALLDRAADTADPRRKLADVSDDELQAELSRREATRREKERIAAAKATTTGAPLPKDRAERERAAREREARVKQAREAREQAERAARATAEQARAGRDGRSQPGATRPGAMPTPRAKKDPTLAKHYEVLEVPYGADWDTVKAAYRRMMRRYHPDLHHKAPDKQKAATEVSTALTVAYNELERALTKK